MLLLVLLLLLVVALLGATWQRGVTAGSHSVLEACCVDELGDDPTEAQPTT